jgi:hypothetical protein
MKTKILAGCLGCLSIFLAFGLTEQAALEERIKNIEVKLVAQSPSLLERDTGVNSNSVVIEPPVGLPAATNPIPKIKVLDESVQENRPLELSFGPAINIADASIAETNPPVNIGEYLPVDQYEMRPSRVVIDIGAKLPAP